MNAFYIDREQLMEHEPHHFTAEASELGFSPGRWPTALRLSRFGNDQPLQLQGIVKDDEGDVLFANYCQGNGCITLKVFND